jgi:hypothetical protein
MSKSTVHEIRIGGKQAQIADNVRLVIDANTISGGTATTEQQQLLLNYTEA